MMSVESKNISSNLNVPSVWNLFRSVNFASSIITQSAKILVSFGAAVLLLCPREKKLRARKSHKDVSCDLLFFSSDELVCPF
jgi:hypothetical protein